MVVILTRDFADLRSMVSASLFDGEGCFDCEGWACWVPAHDLSAKSNLTRNNFAVQYRTGDFQLLLWSDSGTELEDQLNKKNTKILTVK